MKKICACCSMITADIIRAALDIPEKEKISIAKMHLYQLFAWEELALSIGAITLIPEEIPMFGTAPIRFGGVPIKQDISMPHDCVQFLNSDGEILSEIYALAIPIFPYGQHESS